MKMSIILLAILITLNVVTVLSLLLAGGRKKHVPAIATPSLQPDASLQALIDEVEATPAPRTDHSSGEAGLAAALERWRQGGKDASSATGFRHLEHSV